MVPVALASQYGAYRPMMDQMSIRSGQIKGTNTLKCRHEKQSTSCLVFIGDAFNLTIAMDQFEVVSQPRDGRSSDGNATLEGITGGTRTQFICYSCHQFLFSFFGHSFEGAVHWTRTEILDQEATGSVRHFGHSDAETFLTNKCCALITDHTFN